MRRNIEIVRVNVQEIKTIMQLISRTDQKDIEELYNGLNNLAEGKSSSLLLETEESSVNNVLSSGMKFGNLVIKVAERSVTEGERDINLTPKEFDILYFLASHCGQVFTKEQIYQEVWETSYCMDDSNIMAFIRKLRKKIEPDPDSPVYIHTVWGIGYKINDRIK